MFSQTYAAPCTILDTCQGFNFFCPSKQLNVTNKEVSLEWGLKFAIWDVYLRKWLFFINISLPWPLCCACSQKYSLIFCWWRMVSFWQIVRERNFQGAFSPLIKCLNERISSTKGFFLRKLELFYTCITNYFIIALFYCTIFGKKICKNRFFVDVGCVGQKFIFSVKRFSSVIILVDN